MPGTPSTPSAAMPSATAPTPGALVRITGLQSPRGRDLNGRYAAVLFLSSSSRVAVLPLPSTETSSAVSLNPENLRLANISDFSILAAYITAINEHASSIFSSNPHDAKILFQTLLSTTGDSPAHENQLTATRMLLGTALRGLGEFHEAISIFSPLTTSGALRTLPCAIMHATLGCASHTSAGPTADTLARGELTMAYASNGDLRGAIATLNGLYDATVDCEDECVNRYAMESVAEHSFSIALSACDEMAIRRCADILVELRPNHAVALQELGEILVRDGHIRRGIILIERAQTEGRVSSFLMGMDPFTGPVPIFPWTSPPPGSFVRLILLTSARGRALNGRYATTVSQVLDNGRVKVIPLLPSDSESSLGSSVLVAVDNCQVVAPETLGIMNSYIRVIQTRARVMISKKKIGLAKRLLQTSIRTGSDTPLPRLGAIHGMLAQAHRRLGEFDSAVKVLRKMHRGRGARENDFYGRYSLTSGFDGWLAGQHIDPELVLRAEIIRALAQGGNIRQAVDEVNEVRGKKETVRKLPYWKNVGEVVLYCAVLRAEEVQLACELMLNIDEGHPLATEKLRELRAEEEIQQLVLD